MKQNLLSKSLALMAALTIGAGTNASADSETVFSWQGAEEGATVLGGAVTAYDATGADITSTRVNVAKSGYYVMTVEGKEDLTAKGYIKVDFEDALQEGDTILVTAFRNKDAANKVSGFLGLFSAGGQVASSTGLEFPNLNEAVKGTDEYGTAPATCTFIVPAEATGSTSMNVVRSHASTNLFITDLTIKRASAEMPDSLVFDFTSDDLVTASGRHIMGSALADTAGYIYSEYWTDDATNTMLMVTAGSAPSRIYEDSKKGKVLVMYKEYSQLIVSSQYAIDSIQFTLASGKLAVTPTSGTVSGTAWTGNASGIIFQNEGTPYIQQIVLYFTEADESTANYGLPTATECANIAAFNALDGGTMATVALSGAQVIGVSADGYSTAWLQDATGGCMVQYTSLNAYLADSMYLSSADATVYCRQNSGNAQMKEAMYTFSYGLSFDGEVKDYVFAPKTGSTLAEIATDANNNCLVQIEADKFVATSTSAGYLYVGSDSIKVNNGTATGNQQLHSLDDFTKGDTQTNVTVLGILNSASLKNDVRTFQVLPITMTTGTTAIQSVSAVEAAADAPCYNLLGQPVDANYRGIVIQNGRKKLQR